jgi:molybdopterin converting factor small subunit
MGCLLKAMKDSGFMVKKYGDCRFTVTVTELEFKDSASALISFIENFTSKLDDNAKKLKKGDKVSVFPSLP